MERFHQSLTFTITQLTGLFITIAAIGALHLTKISMDEQNTELDPSKHKLYDILFLAESMTCLIGILLVFVPLIRRCIAQ